MNEIVKHEERKPTLAAGAKVAAIVPTSFEETYRVATAIVKSGMAPRGLDTPEKAMVAIMHGMEVGMTPMVALQSIAVVNGNPTIWGDGAIGLVRGAGKLESIEETFEGKPFEDNYTAICRVKRKGESAVIEGRFSVAQAKKAGLWEKRGKNGSPTPWVHYPDRMLKMRARAFALRDGFADILRGLSIREEVEDYPARQARSGESNLAERLAQRSQTQPVDDGFDQSSIEDQLEQATQAQSADPDIIDAEIETDTPEQQEGSETASVEQEDSVANLTEGQIELLGEIEEAFQGCRTIDDLKGDASKFEEDINEAGEVFVNLCRKAFANRRAELGGGQ